MGQTAETGSEKPAGEYPALLKQIPELAATVAKLTTDERPEVLASAMEFVLEGLHLNRRLNCNRSESGYVYRR